ncbi:MAG: asparaginase [Planctomycetota bacterium]
MQDARDPPGFPDQPVLARVWRGEHVESQHRGAWVVTDTSGQVLEGAGEVDWPFFARSSIKSLQALPLIETGAAERWGYTSSELALTLSSHNGERQHTQAALGILARLDLDEDALQCGVQTPDDPDARRALSSAGRDPGAIHNNCSGKHVGFLALARHLGEDASRYLDPASQVQQLVRGAVVDLTGLDESRLTTAIDGCSAPTFRMPLRSLATAFARVASPDGLEPGRRDACLSMLCAVAAHPAMVAGEHKRLCTALVRASGGRLFPKIGAEAIYVVGHRDADRALAVKIDDGGLRGLQAVVLTLLERLGWLDAQALPALEAFRGRVLLNRVGRQVGHIEVLD